MTTSHIRIEDVAHFPLPGMAIPSSIAFRPDGNTITYLFSPQGDLTNSLYSFDPKTGAHAIQVAPSDGGTSEGSLSREEALRRERQRQRNLGITQYAWAPNSGALLLPIKGDLFIQEVPGGQLRRLYTANGHPAIDAQFSPDGKWVAFVRDGEVYAVPFQGGETRQLTFGARETGKTHGLAEFVAQEEMDRSRGYWWSPDGCWLAFEEVDETHMPIYRIVHQGMDETGETAQEDHHYPFAGKENARVRLGIVSIEGSEPVWMDFGDNSDIYLARVNWMPDGSLVAQIENREQTQLRLVRYDIHTGASSTILTETSDKWINLHHMFHTLQKTSGELEGGFIWASERTGFLHLYLLQRDGTIIRPLTGGEWMVDSLAGVDEDKGIVYFTCGKETPLESHLYRVSFAGEEPQKITDDPGMHAVVLDPGCHRFVDICSTVEYPPVVTLRSLEDGSSIATVYKNQDLQAVTRPFQIPKLVQLINRDNTLLYGAIFQPPEEFGQGPFPTIIQVYGGPHAQRVTNNWSTTVNMRAQYLCSLGYLVFLLDNRGSARRGLAFESAIYHDMGNLEVQDQVDGVRWLVAQGLTDPQRVGIYGWSYGGYLSAMCLARAPETFQVAVAGAPVTSWDGYDTCYTERYMGTPETNPVGYQQSSVMSHASKMTGKLMLVHGLIDENVHFRHTARLINALIQARKPYELLVFPDERHMPRSEADRIYMEERVRDFFLQNL